MGRTLLLTSPLEHGHDVEAFQRSLQKNHFYNGEITGRYDSLTAQAAFRAKYWLGYRKPDHVAGDRLYSYLQGAHRPASMLLLAKKRRLAKPKLTLGQKALNVAAGYKGLVENPPASNHQMFGVWYGVDRVAWCNIFVTYCYVKAGSKAFIRGKRYSYVPSMASDAVRGNYHLTIAHPVVTGDVITFDWDHDGTPDHTGLFVKWLDSSRTKFASIEGNTSVTNNSNGGQVCYREDRVVDEVHSFIHVGA